MLKNLAILFVLLFSVSAFAQNKFEGYNLILDATETQTAASCAIRYAPPATTVTVTDLDKTTPMKLSSCAGTSTSVTQATATTATIRANASSGKWCFQGEDKRYQINFVGDTFTPRVTYNWIATPNERDLGFYNVRDFGAKGDGSTDDTIAIQSALAYVASHNGGTLQFPEGDYVVGNTGGFKGITLPSGIVIQGVNGLHTGASTNNVVQKSASRILLAGGDRALFRIGECTEKVTIRDIELYGVTNQNSYGIEALGAFTTSQDFYFERVVFNNFFRGIYAHGLTQTDYNWQFDYVKVNHCRFIYNRDAGIYCRVRNSDWKIEGSFFANPKRQAGQNADSMFFWHSAMILVQDTFSGGFSFAKGGTFLNIIDGGNLTVIGSQCESMTNSLVYADLPGAGDYSTPMTFMNNTFGNPIVFKGRRTFVSMGNQYDANTWTADNQVRVYSTGDRFCYDGYTLGCRGATEKNFDNASIIFMTGQPAERGINGRPTVFGTDVQFNQPVQLPNLLQNALPNSKPNGSMVYCTNCRRSTTPCQSGGSGSPAMVVNGQWSCL
jgi:hypothetical protein